MTMLEALREEGDPLIWWPGAIEDLVRQVDGEIEQLARSVSNEVRQSGSSVISGALLDEFKAFYNEWKTYKKEVGWTGLLTGSTVDRVRLYRARAADWRAKLIAEGASTVVAPAPPASKTGFPWMKSLFVLASVGVGAYAVSKLTDLGKLVPMTRRNPRRRRRRRSR